MARLFISYRREDTQYQADRLHAAICPHVDDPARDIFIDIDNIPLGVNFASYLDEKVSQCEVLLALIGPRWLEARGPGGERRLDDPGDFVRIEIASALKRGIPVVPVLFDGAPVPPHEQLPEDLKELSLRNGVEIRRVSFEEDTIRLARGLGLIQVPRPEPEPEPAPPPGNEGWAEIEDSIEPGNYAAFAEHHPGHPMASEAARRVRQLEAWHDVDKQNAAAIKDFRLAAEGKNELFPALDAHTQKTMDRVARQTRKAAESGGKSRRPPWAWISLGAVIVLMLSSYAIMRLSSRDNTSLPDPDYGYGMEVLSPYIADLTSSDVSMEGRPIRHVAREELIRLMNMSPNGALNRAFLDEIDTVSGVDEYRARMGAAIIIAGLDTPVAMDRRSSAMALLEAWREETSDQSLREALARALRNLDPQWRASGTPSNPAGRSEEPDPTAGEAGQASPQPSVPAPTAAERGQAALETGEYETAYSEFSTSCEAGIPASCHALGALYRNGLGVDEDLVQAAHFFQTACDGGEADACYNLAALYDEGQGVTKDRGRAAELYNLACHGGNELACLLLVDRPK